MDYVLVLLAANVIATIILIAQVSEMRKGYNKLLEEEMVYRNIQHTVKEIMEEGRS